jgi:exosortase A
MREATSTSASSNPITRHAGIDAKQKAWLMVLVSWLIIIGLFWETFVTMANTWAESRTFAHGFLVLPATLYLMSCYRGHLTRLGLSPSRLGLMALAGAAGVWLLGSEFRAPLIQQISVLMMLVAVVWSTLGTDVIRVLAYPLGFLVFALPIGTSVEPWLQDVTAAFIATGLHLTGIPMHWEGYFITISSNTWEVVRDCGGLRYILPGLALAYLYSGVVYKRALRRCAFILASLVLLMLGNGVRAYSIILSDHLGLVNGADHRLFSYSIYGIIILSLFRLGLRWRDDRPRAVSSEECSTQVSPPLGRIAFHAIGAVTLLALTSSLARL